MNKNMESNSEDKIPTELQQYILSIIKKEEYEDYKIRCKNVDVEGGSFVGVLLEIDIIGSTRHGKKELNLFVKNKVENEHMKIYSISNCFVRETFFYKELSKLFGDFQDEASIPTGDRLQIPKHYDETDTSTLILENLSKKGFKVYPKMDVVSVEYAELSIKELAKFHALSFVLQEKRPKYFEENIKVMTTSFNFGQDWRDFIKNIYNYSINCLEPHVKMKVEGILSEKIHDYEKYICDAAGVRTICHGDYKHNNVMVKEVDGRPIEVIPVDYQLLHYGSPILDFIYFMFNGTDQEFRRQHLTRLKDLYYNTMQAFLRYFKIDIERVYKRSEFEKDYKDKLDFGLIFNVFFVPFLFASDEEDDVTNKPLASLSFNVDKRFVERFRGVVDDFIHWGYI